MGVPMDSIHAPTVASSGGTSTPALDSSKIPSREDILSLMAKKDYIEAELTALGSVLDSHGVHMRTTLTTFDGYPRDDIDIAQIRTTRARIIYLKNDHKAIMDQIEKALHSHHASMQIAMAASASSSRSTPMIRPVVEAVFARIDSVAPSSPAEQAGLRVGDKVKRFGSVGALNHDRLTKVAREVQANEGKEIRVLVSRVDGAGSEVDVEISLTPRKDWGGRGMLGCHLLPL